MARNDLRLRVDDLGQLEVVDPGFDTLDLLRIVDPGFEVRHAPLPGFTVPRAAQTCLAGCGSDAETLASLSDRELWKKHDTVVLVPRAGEVLPERRPGEASVLALKTELAFRLLRDCQLCARRCGVDRTRNKLGVCSLGIQAVVAEHFVHIGEESVINPSLLLSLAGCGLRCRYCQQGQLLNPAGVTGTSLDPSLWKALDVQGARSLSFVGGNPDESVYAILRFLGSMPGDWSLPIVWNNHAYSTPETLSLLHGVADAYVPDFKYGSEGCGQRVSGVENYPATAEQAIRIMLDQHVPVIVRLLVLPGHHDCCHIPVLKRLARMNESNLFLSIRGQYCPDWKITARDGELARRTSLNEVEAVREAGRGLALQLID